MPSEPVVVDSVGLGRIQECFWAEERAFRLSSFISLVKLVVEGFCSHHRTVGFFNQVLSLKLFNTWSIWCCDRFCEVGVVASCRVV